MNITGIGLENELKHNSEFPNIKSNCEQYLLYLCYLCLLQNKISHKLSNSKSELSDMIESVRIVGISSGEMLEKVQWGIRVRFGASFADKDIQLRSICG